MKYQMVEGNLWSWLRYCPRKMMERRRKKGFGWWGGERGNTDETDQRFFLRSGLLKSLEKDHGTITCFQCQENTGIMAIGGSLLVCETWTDRCLFHFFDTLFNFLYWYASWFRGALPLAIGQFRYHSHGL